MGCLNCGRDYNIWDSSADDKLYFCSKRCENSYHAREEAAENDRRQTQAAEEAAEYARRQAEAAEENSRMQAEAAREAAEFAQYQEAQRTMMLQQDLEERRKREEREALLAKCVQIKGDYYSTDKTMLVACNPATANLVLPKGVTAIAEDAFTDCKMLKSITFPASMKKIPLIKCESLESVKIEDGVEEIGLRAFMECTTLTEVTIPDSVTVIGQSAFNSCDALKSVVLGKGVREIGLAAFRNCKSLAEITMPEGVTTIGLRAFMECAALKEVTIPASVQTIAGGAFQNTGLTKITIPATVKELGYYNENDNTWGVFSQCKHLKSAVIAEGKTALGDGLFRDCPALTSVTLPDSLDTINWGAFKDCKSLVSAEIPSGVKIIKKSAFSGCTALKEVTIPANVTEIGEDAFRGCTSIKSVELPDSLETIVDGAFMGCSSLASIKIPDGIKKIDANVFSGCTALSSVTISKSVTEIGGFAFKDCTALKEVAIPAGVQTIRGYAFQNTGLTKITIPATVNELDSYKDKEGKYWGAFAKCKSLKSVVIAEGKTALGRALFRGCTALTQVTLPDTLKTINTSAFRGCAALKSVTIPASVTKIGNYAFCGCESLESITIPKGVTEIGEQAFYECKALESVKIAKGVEEIGESAFCRCYKLKSIAIPDSVTIIGKEAFRYCEKQLKSITIPSSVKEIGDFAFAGCTSLETVVMHGKPRMGKDLFSECRSLKGKSKVLEFQTSSSTDSKEKAAKWAKRYNPFYLIKEKWGTILITFFAWGVPAFLLWGAVLPVKVIAFGSLVIAIAQAWYDLYLEEYKYTDYMRFSYLTWLYFAFLYSLHGILVGMAKSGILPASHLGALEWLGLGKMYVPLFLLTVLLVVFRELYEARKRYEARSLKKMRNRETEEKLYGFLYVLAFIFCALYMLSVFVGPGKCIGITVVGLVALKITSNTDWLKWLPLVLGGLSLLLHTLILMH